MLGCALCRHCLLCVSGESASSKALQLYKLDVGTVVLEIINTIDGGPPVDVSAVNSVIVFSFGVKRGSCQELLGEGADRLAFIWRRLFQWVELIQDVPSISDKCLPPLKVVSFSWQLLHDRTPTRTKLSRRSVTLAMDNPNCAWCPGSLESAIHLLFTFFARFVCRCMSRCCVSVCLGAKGVTVLRVNFMSFMYDNMAYAYRQYCKSHKVVTGEKARQGVFERQHSNIIHMLCNVNRCGMVQHNAATLTVTLHSVIDDYIVQLKDDINIASWWLYDIINSLHFNECVKDDSSVLIIPIDRLGTILQLLEEMTTLLEASPMENWEEPCIVFCPRWSLRIGPVVHLLRCWCGDTKSLLILEDIVNPELALFDFLSDVVLGRTSWRFMVRVVRIWEVTAYLRPNQVNSIEMVLVDAKDLFQQKFEEGAVYTMSFFTVAPSVGAYSTTLHPYKLLFQMKTKLELCDCPEISRYGLSLSSIAEICGHPSKSLPPSQAGFGRFFACGFELPAASSVSVVD
ncbi:hypothetical protein TSUD_315970 [Trifolium subterraneum]|uniref:Replication protein A 70 kDa DNA-binding subunit B/D first OB fold domain-containing protein n=1 Tax=Trifolium subterraneum TaxID=3900 RepID=A0A2Z6N2G5_TRISU|nr:hypothetical protein TSUD_315970 [Trifolium subterraneum]